MGRNIYLYVCQICLFMIRCTRSNVCVQQRMLTAAPMAALSVVGNNRVIVYWRDNPRRHWHAFYNSFTNTILCAQQCIVHNAHDLRIKHNTKTSNRNARAGQRVCAIALFYYVLSSVQFVLTSAAAAAASGALSSVCANIDRKRKARNNQIVHVYLRVKSMKRN